MLLELGCIPVSGSRKHDRLAMRALIQRVEESSVWVDGQLIHRIGNGLLVLLGIASGDTETQALQLANKVLQLRIFADENGKLGRSLLEVDGELLVISQFTLYGDTRKGTKPSFTEAAPAPVAKNLYEAFVHLCKEAGVRTGTGVFQAHMKVRLVNDGPVTLLCSSERGARRSW
jgi:D-aminoacyl-tRNA deacylase